MGRMRQEIESQLSVIREKYEKSEDEEDVWYHINMIEFLAEFRAIQSRKLITNDNEVTVKLATSDLMALELAKLPTDVILKVTIEVEE